MNIFAFDAFGRGHMAHGFTVATVKGEGDADLFGVVAGNLEVFQTPAQIRPIDRNPAVVAAFVASAGMPMKEKTVGAHDAVDALAIDRLPAFGAGLPAVRP